MRPLVSRVVNNIKSPKQFLDWYQYQRSRPIENDRMLITLPASGTHWTRILIANLLIRNYGLEDAIEGVTVNGLVPTYRNKVHRYKYNDETSFVRIQHSHAHYSRLFFNRRQCLLQVRDLRDVLVSHFRTYRATKQPDATFRDFIRGIDVNRPGQKRGHTLDTLILFLNSWYLGRSSLDRYKIIRYEDLKKNTLIELASIAEFMNLNDVSEIDLEFAVSESSMEKMAKLEEKKPLSQYEGKVKKVRLNDQSKYEQFFSDEDKEYFTQRVQSSLSDHYGYDYTSW